MKRSPQKIRNIAIVAHIDHGKTTLVDSMLKQSNLFRDNEVVKERMMDSYDQERERGITIFAKPTSFEFEDILINLVDTPGHSDFSGEVQRVLGMVNNVILLIDASDGPMPQTRYVLSQALKKGMKPLVVVNKIDRPTLSRADIARALDKTHELFIELGATDEQFDFPFCYASGFMGYATHNLDDLNGDRSKLTMRPLFELIVDKVAAPTGDPEAPFLIQATSIAYDNFTGRQATGRIINGRIKEGDQLVHIGKDGKRKNFAVTKLEGYMGVRKLPIEEASTGEIVCISGNPDVMIGDTICHQTNTVELEPIEISAPTLSIEISVNTSPFVGREGKHVTMNKIRERLEWERKANVSLKIEDVDGKTDVMRVCGRGELHLSVLLEAMRRENYEFSIAKPQVITTMIEGKKHEPIEQVHIEIPDVYTGAVIQELSRRKGQLQDMSTNEHNITTLVFLIPTRGLIGYRSEFMTVTNGNGILTSALDHYAEWKGAIPGRIKGVLVSINTAQTTAYSLFPLQERGTLFVGAGQDVYEGMIVGENSRDNDLVVNVTKPKQLTNVRASGTDDALTLSTHRKFSLEQSIEFIDDDELVEVTPLSIRMRKKYLTENERKSQGRK